MPTRRTTSNVGAAICRPNHGADNIDPCNDCSLSSNAVVDYAQLGGELRSSTSTALIGTLLLFT